jgi:GAF domain-containing protein
MSMRATTVRFGDDLWALLEREAAQQGISAAQFVRDATIMRIAFLVARRGEAESQATIEQIAAAALRHRDDPPRDAGDDPLGDPGRLVAVGATGLLDAPPDEAFDRLANLAAHVLRAPIAMVSLVDRDRQFFASCAGLPEPWATSRQTPLSHSFCRHAVASRAPLIVDDAREHPALRDSPAIRDLGLVAYAGIPLITPAGHALGTLCVGDREPRTWTSGQVRILEDLAASVMTEISLRVERAQVPAPVAVG